MYNPDTDDDDDDLNGLDRGDDFGSDADDDADAQARDEQGRFKKGEDDKDDDADADADKDDADADKGDEVDAGKDDDKDDDADADADDEADADDDADDDDADARKQNLPIRLNKAKEQRDAARAEAQREREARADLERRLAELEKGKTPAEKEDPVAKLNTELDTLYEQVEEARADGDTKMAATLQRQIDSKNREIVKHEAEQIASSTTSKAAEDARYDAMLDRLETDINAINPDHEDYDPKAVRALEYYVEAHEKMGMPASKALTQAARVVFGYDGKKPEAKDPPAKDDKVVPLKKRADPKKAVDTQKRQPPDLSDRGVNKDDTKINVEGLDDDQWDALPESKRAQMRGDNL